MNLKKTMVGINSIKTNIKLGLTCFIICVPIISFAIDYHGKSLICSTKSHPIKGGFEFVNKLELYKFNILINDRGLKSIKKTSHCYNIVEKKILISDKNMLAGCDVYSSYIDTTDLVYNIPSNKIILSANCKFYEGDLLQRLNESLRK